MQDVVGQPVHYLVFYFDRADETAKYSDAPQSTPHEAVDLQNSRSAGNQSDKEYFLIKIITLEELHLSNPMRTYIYVHIEWCHKLRWDKGKWLISRTVTNFPTSFVIQKVD